jgi:hypothetical protein
MEVSLVPEGVKGAITEKPWSRFALDASEDTK